MEEYHDTFSQHLRATTSPTGLMTAPGFQTNITEAVPRCLGGGVSGGRPCGTHRATKTNDDKTHAGDVSWPYLSFYRRSPFRVRK